MSSPLASGMIWSWAPGPSGPDSEPWARPGLETPPAQAPTARARGSVPSSWMTHPQEDAFEIGLPKVCLNQLFSLFRAAGSTSDAGGGGREQDGRAASTDGSSHWEGTGGAGYTVPELLLTHPGGKPGLQAAKVWGQEGSEVPGASSRSSPLSGPLLVSG